MKEQKSVLTAVGIHCCKKNLLLTNRLLEEWILHLRWFEHVKRMLNERLMKILYEGEREMIDIERTL